MAEERFLPLNWDDRSEDLNADWLSLYRKLLRLRRDEMSPRLAGIEGYAGHYEIIANRAVTVRWKLADGSVLTLVANLSPEPIDGVNVWTIGRLIWLEGIATGTSLEPWCVVVAITDAENVAA